MDFNHYFKNDELEQIITQWSQSYPNIIKFSQLGESYEKRPIWLLTITNQTTGADDEKPAVWIDANIHATEVAGTTTALLIAYNLLNGYGSDPQVTRLLDQAVFYIVPRLNPDGAEKALSEHPRYIRSGTRPYPWEDKAEGLHADDIDGDGRILQMRLVDPNGDWKVSGLDPRLLEKRRPDEHGGTYYRLLPEGIIHNYDGDVISIAHPVEGLDFNRNFPFEWRPEGDQHGAGPYPVSEPEIRAAVEFVTKHPNINIALTYHTFSRVLLRPYSTKPDDAMEVNDLWVYKLIGDIGTKITGYRHASTFHDFRYTPKEVTTGAFDDWLFDQMGVFTFTIEQWDLPTEAGIKDRKFNVWDREHSHEEDLQILKWADEHAGEGAYIDWYPFDHPQLGKVELGGWNTMYTWRNPPAAYMGNEAARNAPFPLALANMLPRLAVHKLAVTSSRSSLPGKNDYHVRLVVENQGFLPTYTSEQGKKRKAIRPVRVELELPEAVTLVSGRLRRELGHLEGRSNKLGVTTIWEASPTDNRAWAEWVLRAPEGSEVSLKVLSERAGSIRTTIRLE
jgi:murein tripeptide amidase MpaA